MQGLVQTAPVIGSYLVHGIFKDPSRQAIIPRPTATHPAPALPIGLFTAHIVLVALQKHTQFPARAGPTTTSSASP